MTASKDIYLQRAGQKKEALRRALGAWFRRAARDLPWRRSNDPYRIWISEVMLQQTRVETVIPYYERFLAAFPDVKALAKANPDRLMKCWEGLGYYGRARNLQKAARAIVNEWDGKFPRTAAEWMTLPGIGRYTAGAAASIAFGERAAVLDGNVKRVFARILDVEDCIDDSMIVQMMWTIAEELVPQKNPGDFNQALMELGAMICTPRRPQCDRCPARKVCEALALRRQDKIPIRKPKKPVPHYEIVAAAVRKQGRYLLGKRPDDSMLCGLWEFPGGKVEPGETHSEALERELREELGIEVRVGDHVASVDHAYTHLTITLHVYFCEHLGGTPRAHYHSEVKWVPRRQFDQYAFPAADLKFLDLLP